MLGLKDAAEAGGSIATAKDELARYRQPYWLVYSRSFHGDPDGEILRFAVGPDGDPVFWTAGVQVFDCRPEMVDRASE